MTARRMPVRKSRVGKVHARCGTCDGLAVTKVVNVPASIDHTPDCLYKIALDADKDRP
jgi:hypothetical protein